MIRPLKVLSLNTFQKSFFMTNKKYTGFLIIVIEKFHEYVIMYSIEKQISS